MKSSIHNSICTLASITLTLFAILSSDLDAVETSLPAPQFSTQKTYQSIVSVSQSDARSFTAFRNDHNSPRAREQVEAIRTAVVPGQIKIDSTVPSYSTPAVIGNDYVLPTYSVPTNTQMAPPPPEETSDEKRQKEITSRFSDPKMLNFVSRTSMRELTTLYHEASRMIDARHVNPTGYEVRVQDAMMNLVAALENTTFLKANGAVGGSALIRQTQLELTQAVRSQPARTATDAVGIMQWAAELVNRRLGIRQEAIALEFLNGTIDSLDNYSSFMPLASAYSPGAGLDLIRTASLEEKIVGIGIEMETHEQGAIVVGIVDNSPASELGLQENDLIVAVNRQSVRGLDLNAVASKLGGPAGTSITLDIDRSGQLFRGSLVRRSIYVSSVTGTKMIDAQNKVGYVRLKQFSASSRKDLEAAMWTLYRQGMLSIILDLRGNPGGLLDQAIDVSNLFVPYGTIVSTKGRNQSDNSNEVASYEKTWSTPLVVLVDGNSASASEIFAAAIQENGRGVVVGRRSYGKGTVQTHFPLQTVSGQLKLTTAKFYSPNGREMAGSGVTPDVKVAEQTTGYRGTDNDADVDAALTTIAQGRPSQLAQQAATGQRIQPNASLSSTFSQPASSRPATWEDQFRSNLLSH